MARTYEILGYKEKKDFNLGNFIVLDEGITNKRKAIKFAKELYNNKFHKVIKVQSSDREFIQILEDKL
jgi:hypothetical protein